ncbi:MAG: hypothetical protein ABIT76_04855 [Chthoniobacterales bacterium]
MKTPASRLLERASDDLGKLQNLGSLVAEKLLSDSAKATKRARYQLRNGATRAAEIEEKIVADFQARPLAYALVAVGLACLVSIKFLWDRQNKD